MPNLKYLRIKLVEDADHLLLSKLPALREVRLQSKDEEFYLRELTDDWHPEELRSFQSVRLVETPAEIGTLSLAVGSEFSASPPPRVGNLQLSLLPGGDLASIAQSIAAVGNLTLRSAINPDTKALGALVKQGDEPIFGASIELLLPTYHRDISRAIDQNSNRLYRLEIAANEFERGRPLSFPTLQELSRLEIRRATIDELTLTADDVPQGLDTIQLDGVAIDQWTFDACHVQLAIDAVRRFDELKLMNYSTPGNIDLFESPLAARVDGDSNRYAPERVVIENVDCLTLSLRHGEGVRQLRVPRGFPGSRTARPQSYERVMPLPAETELIEDASLEK